MQITNHLNSKPFLEDEINQPDLINHLPLPILDIVLTSVFYDNDIKNELVVSDQLSLVCKNFKKIIDGSSYWKQVTNEIGITNSNQNYRKNLKQYILDISKNHLYTDIIGAIGFNKFFLKNVKIVNLQQDPLNFFNFKSILENAKSQFMLGRHSTAGNFIAVEITNGFMDHDQVIFYRGKTFAINFYFHSNLRKLQIQFDIKNPQHHSVVWDMMTTNEWNKFIQRFQ